MKSGQIKYNYVINLDRRTDRWHDINKIINETCLKNHNFIRFSAIDGNTFNEDLNKHNLSDHLIIKKLKENKVSVSSGLIGCFLSHISVLQKISEDDNLQDNDYVGIYEDDFFYSGSIESFNKSYEELSNTNLSELEVDLIYIGGRFKPNFFCINENCFKETSNVNIYLRSNRGKLKLEDYDRCNSSFIVRKGICKKLIDLVSVNFLVNSNTINSAFKINKITINAIDAIYAKLYDNIKMFDYYPHLFYSIRSYTSDISNKKNKYIKF
jgi:GR25 family glycosyltransferase involved in LPS biosynthesis